PPPPPPAHGLHHPRDRALDLPRVRGADAAGGARRGARPRLLEPPDHGPPQGGAHVLAALRLRAEGAQPARGRRRGPLLLVRRHLRRAEEPLPELRHGPGLGRTGVARHGIDPAAVARFRKTRNGALVGETTMRKFGWRIGQEVTLRGTLFPVDL